MPLSRQCSRDAFEENLRKLLDEGFPFNQAFAIAMQTLEDGCRDVGRPTPDVGGDEDG